MDFVGDTARLTTFQPFLSITEAVIHCIPRSRDLRPDAKRVARYVLGNSHLQLATRRGRECINTWRSCADQTSPLQRTLR